MIEDKTCARCGARFGCGRNAASCWCQALPALPAAALRSDTDCLCPDCLAQAVAAASRDDAGADPDPAA